MRLYKQWHRPISKWFTKPPYSILRAASIDSDCCRLLTTSGLSQQQTGQITLQPVSIKETKFLKAIHRTKIRKTELPRSMVVEALNWWSRRASQHPAVQSPVHPGKIPTKLARSPLLVALVGRKIAVVRHQLFPQKPPDLRLWFLRTGVQPSPGFTDNLHGIGFVERARPRMVLSANGLSCVRRLGGGGGGGQIKDHDLSHSQTTLLDGRIRRNVHCSSSAAIINPTFVHRYQYSDSSIALPSDYSTLTTWMQCHTRRNYMQQIAAWLCVP